MGLGFCHSRLIIHILALFLLFEGEDTRAVTAEASIGSGMIFPTNPSTCKALRDG